MSEIYKLEFEVVSPIGKGFRFYAGEQPICRPEEVPDEYWTKTSRETDNPWQQYNQLKAWVKTGEQLIRNVNLFKAASQPEWTPVESSNVRLSEPGVENQQR